MSAEAGARSIKGRRGAADEARAMDGALAPLLLALAATIPALLVHELSRAAVAVALTRRPVCVLLGSGRPVRAVRLGRLLIAPTRRWWWGGECLPDAATSRRRRTAVWLAGPLAADAC